jgi:hypothetical protein
MPAPANSPRQSAWRCFAALRGAHSAHDMRGKFKCRDRIERIDRAAIGGYRHLPNQRIEV